MKNAKERKPQFIWSVTFLQEHQHKYSNSKLVFVHAFRKQSVDAINSTAPQVTASRVSRSTHALLALIIYNMTCFVFGKWHGVIL